jgi:NAD(P)-dependent dehydrogenase (short-subunit alcohol dehydrogenase family)
VSGRAAAPGRRLVVTGSASGIGAATAALGRERGYELIGIDLKDAEVCADLSQDEGRQQAMHAVRELAPDGIDAVVTCAGVSATDPVTVAVNYFGTVELLGGLRPLLEGRRAPRAAAVGSITGFSNHDEELLRACLAGDERTALERAAELCERGAGLLLYPTTKAAVARWLRRTCLAPGWADAGIPLNAVAPGTVLTPMTEPLLADPDLTQLVDDAVPMPLNGHAPPDAVAELLIWLVSEENTHVTGQVMYVDGGAEAVLRGETAF